MTETPTTALVSCMRNEGANLIEWIAYNQVIGFRPIVILTNDCTDGSDELLARLDTLGEVIHVNHAPAKGEKPQFAGLHIAEGLDAVRSSDWVLVQDADEYLTVTAGAGTVGGLITAAGADADAIALFWRFFGTAGHDTWQGEHILPTRTRTHGAPARRLIGHKTLFRPDRFEHFHPHMPKGPRGDVSARNTAGVDLPTRGFAIPDRVRYQCGMERCTFENGWLAHHALKAADVYRTKKYRGFGGQPLENRFEVGGEVYRAFDRNEVENTDILRMWPETRARIDALLQDAETRRLHEHCQSWFQMEIARVAMLERV